MLIKKVHGVIWTRNLIYLNGELIRGQGGRLIREAISQVLGGDGFLLYDPIFPHAILYMERWNNQNIFFFSVSCCLWNEHEGLFLGKSLTLYWPYFDLSFKSIQNEANLVKNSVFKILFLTSWFLVYKTQGKNCFTQFSTRMAAWLLLVFLYVYTTN